MGIKHTICIFDLLKAKLKIFFTLILLTVIIFAAVPKVYFHSLSGHVHHLIHTSSDFSLEESFGTRDCNFEKFDTPVYYTVFKFILNFLPLKNSKQTSFFYHQDCILHLHYNTSLLRGPPVT
ncbi:MAG: hypothetical protein K0R26_535 [Bacteroidota bacterium]|jgi:hypothetical protein|nr:hypothetical protein [Bacteroidota bacterium]